MASEPDDYQIISDNCPGYMVLISEGIICTRCAGEKRHKADDCPKPATVADLATDNVPGADPDGMENADSGMESLSDTSSVSSESTARSDSSETQVTNALRSVQGGNHPQNAHLPRRGFARLAASCTSTQPDRTSPSPPSCRAGRGAGQIRQTSSKVNGRVSSTATHESGTQSRHDRNSMYDPNVAVFAETYSIPRSTATISTKLPSTKQHTLIKKVNDKKRKGSHSHDSSNQQGIAFKANEDRLPSKSLADTMGKFEYSNTTCPSSFGFGRLPSEAMG